MVRKLYIFNKSLTNLDKSADLQLVVWFMCETLVITSRREVGRSTVDLGVHSKWGKVSGRNNDR